MQEVKLDYYFEHLADTLGGEVFEGVNYPWEVLRRKDDRLFQFQKSTLSGKVHPTAIIEGLVQIGQGAVVEPYAVIQGPVIIGEHTLVRSHVLIRPFTIIGRNCVIGHSSEIKNSFIMDEAKIASLCFVGDSILGFGARLGTFTVTENRRFDQKEITFKVNGEVYQTGTDKMGSVIGDFTRTGGSCTIAPGTLIGQYSWIYTDTNVFGFVPKESLLKHRQTTELATKDRLILKRTDRHGNV
ncbi:hypothetical protein HY477_00940 [Candidatus Uhrbacteria bacterium]|nr:hypothetical protein [Candidatus Uhrbacteria bacterium]